MDNNLFVWALIAFAIYYFFFMNKETFTDTDQVKSDLAKRIIAFIDKDTTFPQYLKMLASTENSSYELLKPETFYNFKKIATDSKLIQNDVLQYMKDM